MTSNLQTSIPGMLCIICAVVVLIYGTHSPESITIAGAIAANGYGLLKAKDAND